MSRSDVDQILSKADDLADEVIQFVPFEAKTTKFRADLAGLLVVSMAASYETCVKETLNNFASSHHPKFATFTQNHFSKLSSKVSIRDLYSYTKTFDQDVHDKFSKSLKRKKDAISTRIGLDFTKCYEQILSWRHDFAHAGIRNTTIEEAIKTHRMAKRVLYIFDDSFR